MTRKSAPPLRHNTLTHHQPLILPLTPQVLHPTLLNANMLKAQYAVRGELYLKGEELRKAGRDILYTNGEGEREPRSLPVGGNHHHPPSPSSSRPLTPSTSSLSLSLSLSSLFSP